MSNDATNNTTTEINTEATAKKAAVKKIALIVGSTRENRVSRKLADSLVAFVQDKLAEDVTLDVIDLRDVELPFYPEAWPPAQGRYALDTTKQWAKTIAGYHGFILVSPEYNGAPSPILLNALDTVWAEWNNKPFFLFGYGWRGGDSSASTIKTVIGRLRAELVEPAITATVGSAQRNSEGLLEDADPIIATHAEEITTAIRALQDALNKQ